MSLNTAHLNGGVLIHSGECILVFSDHTTIEWSGQDSPAFKGPKSGRIYLTTHRMIFNHKDSNDAMQSFSFPFITLSDVELEQPIFGANYIKGKVRAQPNGNWMGEAKFKLLFKHGGAIEFGQAMLKAAQLATGIDATRMANVRDAPPPYVPPESQWYEAPPPAYAPPPQGYYGWVPPTQAFPNQPPANSVYMTDAPPPYPGINMPQGGGFQQPPQYSPMGGYPPQNVTGGYPAQNVPGGYPPQNVPGGYPQPELQPGGSYPPQPGYVPHGGYPQGGMPPQGASGFQQGFNPGGGAKAAEAAQSAYYDPSRPQMAFVPPPAYYENPPSYDQATHKKQQ